MTTDQFEIAGARGIHLSCAVSSPEQEPRAVLFCVHGLGEHQGRYEDMTRQMVQSGFAVFVFDLRGHGRSEGRRGHAASITTLLEDTSLALMKCRSLYLDEPIVMFGHSMGGQIVAQFIDKDQSKELSGAIISSPWLSLTDPPPAWQLSLIKIFARIAPGITLPNGLDPSLISSLPQEVDLYKKDPKIHDRISFVLFQTMYRNGLRLLSNAKPARIPTLVCHGTSDGITNMKASKEYALRLGDLAIFHPWEDAYHEPHHDRCREEVLDYYAHWVGEHLK